MRNKTFGASGDLPYYVESSPMITHNQQNPRFNRSIRARISTPANSFPPTQRKASLVLCFFLAMFAVYCCIILYFVFPFHTVDPASIAVSSQNDNEMRVLYNLVDMQNRTIYSLTERVKSVPFLSKFYQSRLQQKEVITTVPKLRDNPYVTAAEKECNSRYGLQIVNEWRNSEEEWCRPMANSPNPMKLKCYPFLQKHRAEQGKGKDTFCVAENVVLDFSLIYGDIAQEGIKLFYQVAYLDLLLNEVMSGSCEKTLQYNVEGLGTHTKRFFTGFRDNVANPDFDIYENDTTYFLPRDEDCENTFHSLADFMNMYVVKEILDYDVRNQQVLIMDKMPNSQYIELLKTAFAPTLGVHRHGKYFGKKVMFKKMIFHLESPASLVFPETSTDGPQKCKQSSLFDAYRRHVLHSFDLLEVPPPSVPTAALILRHRTFAKNVGRVMANENQIIDSIKNQGNMMRLHVIDLASMSYRDQLRTMRGSNILIGVHGAGLTWIMFAAEEAVLLEVHPSYREDRHFRHIARLSGKDYLPMRSLTRESCVQTSDNVEVPINEFLDTLNDAVRLARNYDSGISECGLHCPSPVLALNDKLSEFYDDPTILNFETTKKTQPIDKSFPCPLLTT